LTTATEIQQYDVNQQSDIKKIQYNYKTGINEHKICANHEAFTSVSCVPLSDTSM